MTATRIFTGFELAAGVQRQTRARVEGLGRSPVCVTLHDEASPPALAYLRRQMAMASEAGVTIRPEPWPATDAAARLSELAADPGIDAVATLFPLPAGLTPEQTARLIGPERDADGQHPLNAGALLLGHGAPRPPATAMASLLCARAILGDLTGAEIVLVGASALIGRPLAMLLADAGATVTMCHVATRDLAAHSRRADLIVSAAGVPGLLTRDHVTPGGRVLDLAIVRTATGLVGDADRAALEGHAGLLSHVPDGVGPVTTACLIANIAAAACGTEFPVTVFSTTSLDAAGTPQT